MKKNFKIQLGLWAFIICAFVLMEQNSLLTKQNTNMLTGHTISQNDSSYDDELVDEEETDAGNDGQTITT